MAKRPAWSSLTFTLPVVVVLALINIYLLMNMHYHNGDTTVILSEKVYNKNSDSSSELFKTNLEDKRNKYSGYDDWNPDLKGLSRGNKRSGNDESLSPERNSARTGNDVTDYVIFTDTLVDNMINDLKQTKFRKTKTLFSSYFWNMTMNKLTRQLGFVARSQAKPLAGYADIKTYVYSYTKA